MRNGTDIKTQQASRGNLGKNRVKVSPGIYVTADTSAGENWIVALRVLHKATNRSTSGYQKRKESSTDD